MQYPYGQIGHGFTHEEYRMKGLVRHVVKKISKQIIANEDLPELNTLDAYSTSFKKVGFTDMYNTLWLEVKGKGL